MLYKIDKNPDWNVFLNMAQEANLTDKSGEQQKVRIHKNPFPTLIVLEWPYLLERTVINFSRRRCGSSAVVRVLLGRRPVAAGAAASANC